MTDFRAAYRSVHDSVVGLGFSRGAITRIFGTGFVVHSKGARALVATNEHVIRALQRIPDGQAPTATVFRPKDERTVEGETVPAVRIINLPVQFYGLLSDPEPPTAPAIQGVSTLTVYPYPKPDLGYAAIDCSQCRLPSVTLSLTSPPEEGLPIALLGYPLGVEITPVNTGELVQCTPILQSGVVSAILPARTAPRQTYVLHLLSGGGCSGSPLFDEEGRVLGVVFASFTEPLDKDNPDKLPRIDTSQLLAVPVTEYPEEFLNALQKDELDDLYAFLEHAARQGKS